MSLENREGDFCMKKEENLRQMSFISIGVILLYFFWPMIINGIWNCFNQLQPYQESIFFNIITNIILLFIVTLIYKNDLKKEWQTFIEQKKNYVSILKYTVIIFGAILCFNIIMRYVFHFSSAPNETILYDQSQRQPLLTIFMVTLYYPIVEGIVFQKTIYKVIKNPWIFIVVSSLFFTYFNIAFTQINLENVITSLQYVISNSILAFAYYKSNTIFVSVGTKMFYNFLISLLGII